MSQVWRPPCDRPGDPRRTRTGFWEAEDWDFDRPGTFAVVVGVSRYPNMGGGSSSYGFDEGLYVSASTAFAYYRWLTSGWGFAWPDAEPARTWLLLAPTEEELAFDQDLAGTHYASPTFDGFEAALSEWYKTLEALPGDVAEKSCGMLFFSGHGVSYGNSGQLLLPSDWPNPSKADPRNWAPRSGFLLDSLSVLDVRDFLFFIDACWENGGRRVGNFKADGIPVLPLPADDALKNSRQHRPVIYAATAGQSTLQPDHPRTGYSVFGEALLSALTMPGGTREQDQGCTAELCPVQFSDLVRDVTARVQTLLRDKAHLPDELSYVTDGGSGVSLANATWRRRAVPFPRAEPLSPRTEDEQLSHARSGVWRTGENEDVLHGLVGHELITESLAALRFYDTAQPTQREMSFRVSDVRSNESVSYVRCDVELEPGAGSAPVWAVTAVPGFDGTAWATTLPAGAFARYSMSYRLDGNKVANVQFNVSPRNLGAVGYAAGRWNIARDVTVAGALIDLPAVDLVAQAMRADAGRADVLAAEIAVSLSLTTGAFAAIPVGWLRRLWQENRSPNSAVLLAQRLIMDGGRGAGQASEILTSLRQLGLPTIRSVIELLDAIALRKSHRGEPLAIEPWLAAIRPLMQPSGLLSAFSGPAGRLGPWIGNFAPWSDALDRYAPDTYLRPPPALIAGRQGQVAGIRVPSWLVQFADVPAIAAFQSLASQASYAGTVTGMTPAELAKIAQVQPVVLQVGLAKLNSYGAVAIESDPAAPTELYRLRDAAPPESLPGW